MSYEKNHLITADDSASIDAFGRWRVAAPYTIFDSKLIHDAAAALWDDQEVSGGSTTSSHSADTASSTIGVGATTAGNRTRQTFMRFNYQPGKSQLVLMTFVLDKSGGGTGITRNVGLMDDDNGLFLQDAEGTYQFVRRTSTSGSPVDNAVTQANWNIDPMDGSGPSGVTIDFTKAQILFIDVEWLGVGRVRCGFVIDGQIIYAHQWLNANNLSQVYMSTPNLPLRYEIDNDGTGAASTLECICSSVESEGGVENNGLIHSYTMGNAVVNANTAGTSYALVGIRLKSTHLGANVKPIAESVMSNTSDDFAWTMRLNPTIASTAPTFNGVTNSAVEVAVADTSGNPSVNTVTGGSVIMSGYASGQTPSSAELVSSLHLGAAIDGTRDQMWLCATPVGSGTVNADISGSLTWRELQ